MTDQADQLRKLVRDTIESQPNAAPGLPLVALSGGTPQVGVTSTLLSLARELGKFGKRVLVIDANLSSPAVHESFPLRFPYTLVDVLNGQATLKEASQSAGDGLFVLPGSRSTDAVPKLQSETLSKLFAGLQGWQSQVDVVLADVGYGMTPWVNVWWHHANQVVLVTTPEEWAIKGAYANVKLAGAEASGPRVQVVVNQCADEASGMSISERFRITCQRFLDVPVLEAAPIPPGLTASKQGQRAMRLLAADIIAPGNLDWSAAKQHPQSQTPLPAPTNQSSDSTNQIQQAA